MLSVWMKLWTSSLTPGIELGGQWPPAGVEPINPFNNGEGSIILFSIIPFTLSSKEKMNFNPHLISGFSAAAKQRKLLLYLRIRNERIVDQSYLLNLFSVWLLIIKI